MKINSCFFVGLVFTFLICAPGYGQQALSPTNFAPPAPIPMNGDATAVQGIPVAPLSGLSDWILYKRDCCEGHPGKYTPLYTELYLRAGPSIPVGGQTLSRELETGWSIIGGARALFFNPSLTRAWTVDAHIINTNQGGVNNSTPFPLTVTTNGVQTVFGANGVPGATVKDSNRTMVGLGLGREWYLWNSADSPDCRWRVGVDVGGRWGSHKLEINETIRHLTDVIAGVYVSAHTDLEIPFKNVVFFTGLRLEWAQTFSDVLQQNSNVQDLSILLSAGIRF